MKILFVGVLNVDWSTNIPMKREFEKAGHQVVSFNYRTIAQHYAKESNDFFYQLKDKLGSLLRISWLPSFLSCWYYKINGRAEMNQQLLREIFQQNYDLVFLCKADSVDYRIIPKINEFAKTWYFHMDPCPRAKRMKAYEYAKRATWASATFSSVDRLFKKHGAKSRFLTQGVDTELFCPGEEKKEIDVIFVGSISKKRERIVNFLQKKGIKIVCFGPGWPNKPIYREELVDKYRKSKIILNICRKSAGFSIRIFQAMGTGGFMLSEYCSDLERIFTRKKHLDWFKNERECFDLVRHYLDNDEKREKIARQGSKFVLKNYSWEKIINKIIAIIQGKQL